MNRDSVPSIGNEYAHFICSLKEKCTYVLKFASLRLETGAYIIYNFPEVPQVAVLTLYLGTFLFRMCKVMTAQLDQALPQMRSDSCACERRIDVRIVPVNAVDGGVFLNEITHIVVGAIT